MTHFTTRPPLLLAMFTAILLLAVGCAVSGGGYGYGDGSADVGPGYYEPVGFDYGGWGPGYQVGPYRDGDWRGGRGGGAHAYQSAPASHAMHSIPTASRGGGGGHGGGGVRSTHR